MSLFELVDNSRTDKNTVHSYLGLYETLFWKKKQSVRNILEVGIGDGNQGISDGGSIKLWHDYFPNATVHALDCKHSNDVWDGIKNSSRIKLYTSIDAYSEEFFREQFLYKNIKCDIVLDDGPHTLESQKQFVRLYSQILAEDGILVIEDLQDWNHVEELKKVTPAHLQKYVKGYDLRANKNRGDDMVFTIDKSDTAA